MRAARAVAALLLAGCAATSPEPPVVAATALLQADRDFAADAAAHGVHAAFRTALAEDAIVFRPGAVIAHAWLAENPGWAPALAWEPDRAEVSAGADLGFTSGTWSARGSSQGSSPGATSPGSSSPGEVTAEGRYITVWRRVDDRWQAVLDHGVALGAGDSLRRPLHVSAPLRAVDAAGEAAPEDAVALDMLFAVAVGEGGDALSTLLAPDVQFLRAGRLVDGREAAAGALAPLREAGSGCEGAVIARDGTLSATWGTASAPDGEYSYLRVWRAAGPEALPQLVLDLLAPLDDEG